MKIKYLAGTIVLCLFIALFSIDSAEAKPIIFTGKMSDEVFRRNVQVALDLTNKYTPESVTNIDDFKPLQESQSIYFGHLIKYLLH